MTALRLPRAWLTRAPERTFFLSLAVASSLCVVLLLEGFQSGLYAQMERVVLRRGAELVVAQAGVANFMASRSKLPQTSRKEVDSVPGVAKAYPMTMVPIFEAGGNPPQPGPLQRAGRPVDWSLCVRNPRICRRRACATGPAVRSRRSASSAPARPAAKKAGGRAAQGHETRGQLL